MDIIKESAGSINVLRTTGWVYTLAYFLSLFEEAKKDFPTLQPESVIIVRFGGNRYPGTYGIEFPNPKHPLCPAGYQKIVALEHKR